MQSQRQRNQNRRHQRRRRQPRRHRRRWIWLLVVVVLVACGWGFYASANHDKTVAQNRVTALAKSKANLTTVSNFFIYNQERTYYSVAGVNKKNQQLLVIVPAGSSKVTVLKQSSGITGREAIQVVQKKHQIRRVLHTALGIYRKSPVWEVAYYNTKGKLNYALVNFKTGKIVEKMNNL
ncbi:cell wall elongation regulator TseB-like domain-containing protein [Limosilactobacillus gastricus]|uniref:cell wall elongation regulator TseB-like domain-containing protein n=1 Tax=Limosilactobacillus gastricus TaxID=227942 RepID=UPI0026F184E6|nr:DUF5590 domain-containing protein [Limosilactobacillus gastricus]